MAKINAKTTGGGGIETVGDASGVLELQSAGTTRQYIDANGNVGIGTSSPNAAIEVARTAAVSGFSATGIRLVRSNFGGEINGYINQGVNAGLILSTVDSGTATERMRIDSNGNVGISTASPITKLNISGSSGFSGELGTFAITGNTSAKRLAFGVDSTSTMQGWIQSVENGIAARELVLQGLGGAVLFNGSTASSGIAAIQKGGAGGGCVLQFFKPNSGATNVILNYFGTSTYVGGMNMDNTSTSFITSSDARLKKDIVESESASEKIDNIRVVSHGWKHDDAVVDYGLIAQELHEIMPRAVTKGDDGEEVETVWSVDYSKLVPMLIKAHQEQQAIITDLKARIEVLEGALA
jgi:hypothetical protein